jgi:hypothetical protein
MRDNKFGRWAVRLAVTIGAGAVALGVTSAAANASDLSYRAGIVGAVQPVVSELKPIYVTEDYGWG